MSDTTKPRPHEGGLSQIPRDQLIDGRFYIGRGRNGNVGRWFAERDCFMVASLKLARLVQFGPMVEDPCLKMESYYDKDEGCFQPFQLIDEGVVVEPVGPCPLGWDAHYAKHLLIPSPPAKS